MGGLAGKVALITGGTRGIGKAIAMCYARQGATVIINYAGNEAAAVETVDEIRKSGGTAESYCCNVADQDDVKSMTDYVVEKYKKLDILVNNAGITRDNLLIRMSEDDFTQVLDVNLKGTYHCMHACARQMLKQRDGVIINLSSVVGLHGNAGQANYAASKAGIIGLTKSVAKELAKKGVRVNAIAPGYIDTDMTKILRDQVKEQIIATIPLQRMGTAEDVANMALFLASDSGSYITGQVISVDGGMSI